jgi:hypothetical protein
LAITLTVAEEPVVFFQKTNFWFTIKQHPFLQQSFQAITDFFFLEQEDKEVGTCIKWFILLSYVGSNIEARQFRDVRQHPKGPIRNFIAVS